ncbi:MAG TPA: hypothetical protein VIJ19_08555 [Opitutaceae bacterium]
MNSEVSDSLDSQGSRIPLAAKVAYSLFVAIMVPVYWASYGPTNFLFFCDVAVLLTFLGIWTESSLLISMCCVGILLPQMFWIADFGCQLLGFRLTGMTGYMFRPTLTLFARGLSLFHGWLPILLVWLVWRLGYDRRALRSWGLLATALVLFSYFFLPPSGTVLADPNTPVNIDYVYGFNDKAPQHWMDERLYVGLFIAALWLVVFLPTHLLMCKFVRSSGAASTQA